MIEIKDINGNTVLKLYSAEDDKRQSADAVALGSGSVWVRELGGKDCIRLKFSLDRPLHIGIGYHIETESYGRFTMTSDYSPEYNAATGGYDYEVAFDAWYHSWNRYLFMLHPQHGARETSFNLTDRIMGHISLLEENIEQRFGPEAVEELFIEIQPSVSTEKAVNVTYDSLHIVDAISAMAEAFECEWWMQDGNHLCFGRCERDNDPMEWTAGRNAASITPSGSSGAYATRLYVFGGTANIPKRYRKKLVLAATEIDAANGRFRDANRKLYPSVFAASVKDENRVTTTAAWGGVSHQVRLNPDNAGAAKDEASWIYCDAIPAKGMSFTIEGVLLGRVDASYFTSDYGDDSAIAGWEQRLMMPADSAPGNHIDSASIKGDDGKTIEEMVVEQVVVFDDVYPHKRTRISRVDSYTTETEDQSDENGNAPVTVTHYRLMVEKSDFEFSEDYLLSGQTLRCTFMTGKMAGMSFDLKFGGDVNGTSMQEYEVINSEDYGVLLPNTQLYPSEGDEMVLTGYDVSYLSADGNSLIASAEEELQRKGREYQSKLEKNKATYTVKLEPQYAADEGTIVYLGSKVTLRQATGELIATSRVIAMEVKLDIPYDTPVYTVGESRQYSRLSEIEGKVSTVQSQLVMGGAAGTGSGVEIITSDSGRQPTDSNVYSALASDNRFLSKTRDDTAKGRITFSKGADFGQFVSGIVGGAGGRIDPKGNAELESLVLRSFLEVPELRFNRIDVVSGELWNSIAFGTISSVTIDANGTGGTAWVHLEETERCGLKVGDICRGIYSDFGDGRAADEDDDSNGFKKTYGFSTAYFTPTSIIKNEEGEFGFNYQIQPGTKVHPCAYMKFAVYGSFTDPSRRASAYFTRSYMRYLKNVQTWQIDPDRNIASQFGNLDGLTIGGMHMQGEGTFLSNIYMTGAIIQFTPQQKEELKGQDAYSVVLSDYECVLHVTSDGFVKDINKIRNVIVNGCDVMAMKDGKAVKVVDLGYNATAAVQVYKGKNKMHHAPIVGESAYTIVPSFHNCEGAVTNGVLIVTKVVDTELDAYVDLEVNCEGNALFEKHFAITVVKDASSPVTVDLDNDMDTVVENPLTGEIVGSPLTTTAMMRYGTDDMEIVLMSAVEPLPDGIRVSIEGSTASVDVDKEAGETSAIMLRVVGKTAVSETLHTREVRFIANKVRSQYQLKLVPSVAEVKVDADGTFNGSLSVSVKCQVLVNDGTSSLIPDTYEALKGYRARMFYGVNVKSDLPDFTNEVTDSIYADGVAVTSSDDSVTFWLYYYPNGINVTAGRVRFDMETIHVLHDASDSFKQFVFKRVNADSVAAPKGGSYSSPLPDGWSDGVPAGSAKLWMSSRRFTSNGKNQDDAWSTPRPMTDTADFDVCFHDAVSGDAAPSAPPKDMHPTQTGMSGNNGWYDDGKTTSEWMAMATCSNGVWSDWSIVKIVGESPVIADIDNEMDGIGVGSDGILDVATSTSTNVCMYHGSRLMQIRSVSVSGLPSGVTASTAYPSSSDHSRCTVTFSIAKDTDFSVKNRYAIVLTIVATYNDVDYTRTLTYTLLGTTNGKDGEVYYLQPSTTAVTRDKDLVYHPASLTCAKYVKKGVSDPVASTEGEIKMSTDGGSTWTRYDEITTSSLSGVNSVIYRWMLNGTEVDRETVPVILDGQSALSLQVSQTQGSVQMTSGGYTVKETAFTVTAKAYFGIEKESIVSVSVPNYSTYIKSGNVATITITIPAGISFNNDKANLGFTVLTGRGNIDFTFSIAGVRNGERGDLGPFLRPCGVYVSGRTYVNNSEWVDVVYYQGTFWHVISSSDGSEVTVSDVPSESNAKWKKGSYLDFVATNLFLASMAYIENLGVKNVLMQDGDTVDGGFCTVGKDANGNSFSLGNYRLWLGAATPSAAPFRIDRYGNMYATSGVFEGSLKTKFVSSTDAVNFDKLAAGVETITLPNGVENVGREVTIYNSRFNQTRVPSATTVKVKDGSDIMGAKVRESGIYGSVWKPSVYAQSIEFWGGIIKLVALPNTATKCLWMIMFARVEGGYFHGSYDGNSYTRDINDPMFVNGLRFAAGTSAGSDSDTIYFVTE